MSERAPYSRVYWTIVDDPKFAAIYDDDATLALWLRLLLQADATWPAAAPLPRSARSRPLGKLVDAGLVDRVGTDRYRIHGLEAERGRRQSAASASASQRWTRSQSERNANASRTHPKSDASRGRDEDETRRGDARDPFDDPEADVVTWLAKHGCALQPHSGYYRHVVTMVESHGVNAVVGMLDRLASAGTKSGDVKGYVFGARDALDAQTRPNLADVGKADRADADARAHQARLDRTQRELRALREVGS